MGSAKPMLAAAKASHRILIVDDLPEMRKLIRTHIEEETDFCVCGEAIDGLEAIDKAKI